MNINPYSFQKGFKQVQNKDLQGIKEKIMKALNLANRSSWYKRLYGSVEPRVSEQTAIQAIFAAYGITDIWGE